MVMTKKFYQTEEFQKLQGEWYGKLKDEGFPDIEAIGPDGDAMDKLGSSYGCYSSTLDTLRKYKPDQERYYELARAHFWNMSTRDKERREAFQLYADGDSYSLVGRKMGWTASRVKKMVKEEEAKFLPRKPPKLRLV